MSRKTIFTLLTLLISSAVIVWATDVIIFNSLLFGSSNPFVIILSFLGFVVALQGGITAIQKIGDFLFDPLSTPGKEEIARKTLHSRKERFSEIEAKGISEQILGDENELFWQTINMSKENGELLHTLALEPFMLDGLITIYQKKKKFPARTGELLDTLLRTQWKREILETRVLVRFEQMQAAFARIVDHKDFYMEYPSRTILERFSNKEISYEALLDELGTRAPWWRWVDYIVGTLDYQFHVFIDRNIPEKLIVFLELLRWILRNFYLALSRAATFLILVPLLTKRRAKNILLFAEKANLIEQDGRRFRFRNVIWVEYFSAIHFLNKRDGLMALKFEDDSPYWFRDDLRKEKIAVIWYGLSKEPEEFIKGLFQINPYLAAVCLANSGEEYRPQPFTKKVVEWLLEQIVLDSFPESPRALLMGKLIRTLDSNPAYVIDVLKAIQSKSYDTPRLNFVKLLASYGTSAIDILISHFQIFSQTKISIILALGEIGNARVLSFLKNQMAADNIQIKYWAAFALWYYFDDLHAAQFLRKGLLQTSYAWQTLEVGGERSVRFAISALKRDGLKMDSFFPEKLAALVKDNYGDDEFTLPLLREFIHDGNPRIRGAIANCLGALKTVASVDQLIELLENDNGETHPDIIKALVNTENPKIGNSLIAFLYSSDISILAAAISGFREIRFEGAVDSLIEKLSSNEDYYPRGSRYPTPIPLLAAEALAYIGVAEGEKKAADWCVAHLDDERETSYYGGRTISEAVSRMIEYHLGRVPFAQTKLTEWQEKKRAN